MTLYLEGTIPLSANVLSLKEATVMSREIKYIGMDVHKEAVFASQCVSSVRVCLVSQSNGPASQDATSSAHALIIRRPFALPLNQNLEDELAVRL
jgi:hypothetical protein